MPRERNSQIVRIIKLIKDMTESPNGVLFEDLPKKYSVSRRTIERDIIALEKAGYNIETCNDDDNPLKVRKKIITENYQSNFPVSIEEIASARTAQKALAREANQAVSHTFKILVDKLEKCQSLSVQNDGDGIAVKQSFVMKPSYNPVTKIDIVPRLQQAILKTLIIKVHYRKNGIGESREYLAEPYGILFGAKNYLVWRGCEDKKYRLFALPYIDKVIVTEDRYEAEDFDLEKFAETSFGIYNSKPFEIELLVLPNGRPRLDGFSFHPSQTIKSNSDGSATVRFNASGLDELCWHLFSWGDNLKILAPEELKQAFKDKLQEAKNISE